jgi:hypothetical protein
MQQSSKLEKQQKRLQQQVNQELARVASLHKQQYDLKHNGCIVKKERELQKLIGNNIASAVVLSQLDKQCQGSADKAFSKKKRLVS